MSIWNQYPPNYRANEVDEITRAVCAGQCVSVVGLSGSGKSNLLGFIAHRIKTPETCPRFVLVDCNRLIESSPQALFRLMRRSLDRDTEPSPAQEPPLASPADELAALDNLLSRQLANVTGICFLLDRFEALTEQGNFPIIASNLRALRDTHKYLLTYVTATRRPIDHQTELAELFFGRTLWLGPLSDSDALWSARRDATRFSASTGEPWSEDALEKLVELSWGYPSLLRAACEAYAGGAALELVELSAHPAITRRVSEFWADDPSEDAVQLSGLENHPLLAAGRAAAPGKKSFDTTSLTAKEILLLDYFLGHPGEVCEKDNLIRAIWPEDVIFEQGIRDDSLAQLVRRLRVKIEPDPSEPTHIHNVPGRGYLFKQTSD